MMARGSTGGRVQKRKNKRNPQIRTIFRRNEIGISRTRD